MEDYKIKENQRGKVAVRVLRRQRQLWHMKITRMEESIEVMRENMEKSKRLEMELSNQMKLPF